MAWRMVFVLALVLAGRAGAQDTTPAPTDSTAAAVADSTRDADVPLTGLNALGKMAQEGTVPDSLLALAEENADETPQAVQAPPAWYTFLTPTLRGTVRASVSDVSVRGSLSAPVFGAIGAKGSIQADEGRTTYRQFDRDQEDDSLRGDLSKKLGESINLRVDFARRTNRDENRPVTGDPIVLELESRNASASLDGLHDLPAGFTHRWAVAGDVEDVDQSNRNVRNDRSLASAGLSSIWTRTSEAGEVKARYGYKRSTGDRLIRGITQDATVEVDTLQAKFALLSLPRTNLDLDLTRSTFFEERLDFRRNANGVIDTVGVVDPVGEEREVSENYAMILNGSARVLPSLNLTSRRSYDFEQTTFRLSDQRLTEQVNQATNLGATWSYASAGSLQIDYRFQRRDSDRYAEPDPSLPADERSDRRGPEITKTYTVSARLRQGLFAQSGLLLEARQQLNQNVFREADNDNDRDRLIEEAAGEIETRAVPWTTANVRGTIRNTREVNIAADRVGNNKDELLYEVRTTYTIDPPGGLSASQTYRLQIVFRDYFDGIDRDTYNKQGQVTTNVDWTFPKGGRLGLEYLSDFRSTGNRDEFEPVRELYFTTSVREDRRLTARASVPIAGVTVTAAAERGFLDQEQAGRFTEEERGKLSLRAKGQWKFFKKENVVLDIDVERVVQFGPRVRDEQEDYWVANSAVTVTF